MRAAVYARVSTTRQAQAQMIEQQLDRLCAAVAERGWELDDQLAYRADGYSGARPGWAGLDRLRRGRPRPPCRSRVTTSRNRITAARKRKSRSERAIRNETQHTG